MTIKIKADVIGIKTPIEVKPTIDKVEMAREMLRKAVKAEADAAQAEIGEDAETEDEEVTDVEATQNVLKSLDAEGSSDEEMFDFLKKSLDLTKAQINKAKKLVDEDELGTYVFYVISRLRGVSDEVYELGQQEMENKEDIDPKKD